MVGTAEELCFSLACWRTKDETMLLISTSVVSCAEALPSNYCNYDLRISYYLSLGISSLILGGFSHVFLLCYVQKSRKKPVLIAQVRPVSSLTFAQNCSVKLHRTVLYFSLLQKPFPFSFCSSIFFFPTPLFLRRSINTK